jgi:uncharacterized membrane protein
MKNTFAYLLLLLILPFSLLACTTASSDASGPTAITATNGELLIPLAAVSDGKAHHYKVKADDGTMVTFFVLKSKDGVLRAAIDACDVCYKAGKGYYQEGDFMVCENCGQRFASNRINVIKGGCNPAPLDRTVNGDKLVIAMKDINANTWYMKFRLK